MEVLGSLLAVAAIIVVIAYIAQPFLAPRREEAVAGQDAAMLRQRAEVLAERNALYAAIRDLDFDHQTGKVSDQDYAEQRYKLVAQAVDLLQRLDALPSAGADDPLERLILSLREGEPLTPAEVEPPHDS